MKLNLGAGSTHIEGFAPVDRKLGSEVYPLAYPDNSADEIRASHVLEHFSHAQTLSVLKEWVRVLKPGGVMKIAVPNIIYAAANDEHPHFEGWITGGQTDENDYHKSAFTPKRLFYLLEIAGLTDIKEWKSEIQDCAALPVSLNLQGTKTVDAQPESQEVKIACALSMPRLGFNDTWSCITNALSPWNIPVIRYQGAWWEKVLQNIFEDMIAQGTDVVVCCDYDGVFTSQDFDSLLHTMMQNPQIDAICGLQARRGNGRAMFGIEGSKDGDTVQIEINKPVKITTGHFGLSLLRLDRLKDIPKPWFVNVPGKGGSWRQDAEGQIDADIYFWHQWQKHGRSLYMLPAVNIGHLETVVSRIDLHTGKAVYTYPDGKPLGHVKP